WGGLLPKPDWWNARGPSAPQNRAGRALNSSSVTRAIYFRPDLKDIAADFSWADSKTLFTARSDIGDLRLFSASHVEHHRAPDDIARADAFGRSDLGDVPSQVRLGEKRHGRDISVSSFELHRMILSDERTSPRTASAGRHGLCVEVVEMKKPPRRAAPSVTQFANDDYLHLPRFARFCQ